MNGPIRIAFKSAPLPAQVGSPDWVTAQLERFFSDIFHFWSRRVLNSSVNFSIFAVMTIALGGCLLVWINEILRGMQEFNAFAYASLQSRFAIFGLLLAVGPFAIWRKKHVWIWPVLLLTSTLLTPILHHGQGFDFSVLWSHIPIFSSAVLAIFILTNGVSFPRLALIGLTLLSMIFTSYFGGIFFGDDLTTKVNLHNERIVMSIFVVLAQFEIGNLNPSLRARDYWNYFFSPAFTSYFLPLRNEFLKKAGQPDPFVLLGFSDLFVALTSLTLGGLFGEFENRLEYVSWAESHWALFGIVHGWVIYIYYFFNSFALMRIGTGICRWLGYGVPDGYHFPLLAVTPQDRWRRWNIYFYHFFRSFVFLPSMRKTRSVFLACMATFFVTFLFHRTTQIIDLLIGDFSLRSLWGTEDSLYFFLAHGLIVWLGIATARFWPAGNRLSGWLGILVTNLLMAWVHTFVVL